MDTDDVALKRRKAIYNNANLLATDMDFSSAAMQYAEALKIDDDDFQAKKNLERMRLGEQQFNTLFSPEQQEREDRVEALKLLPWGRNTNTEWRTKTALVTPFRGGAYPPPAFPAHAIDCAFPSAMICASACRTVSGPGFVSGFSQRFARKHRDA